MVAGNVIEEPVDRGLEVSQARVVLVPQCLLLHQAPQPLDQIEVGCIGRQVDQRDPTTMLRKVRLDLFGV
jgi:hypothetical protein